MSVVGKSVVEQRHLDVVRVLLEANADLSLTNAVHAQLPSDGNNFEYAQEGKTALQQATAPEMRLALGGQGTSNVASGAAADHLTLLFVSPPFTIDSKQ